MSGSRSRTKPQGLKLKDSCDMCSASKVRCDKQKPMCGRCERLAYPCFYSPARRVGRPYPRRTSAFSRSQSLNLPEDLVKIQQPDEKSRTTGLLLSAEQASREVSDFACARKTHTFQKDGESELIALGTRHYSARRASTPEVRQQPRFSQLDLLSCTIPSACDKRANAVQSVNETQTDSTKSRVSPELFEEFSVNPTDRSTSASSPSDCISIALGILRELDMTNIAIQLDASSAHQNNSPLHLDAALQSVTFNLRRLTIILICPCSETSEVGLLVASACMTILEIMGVMIDNFPKSQQHIAPQIPIPSAPDHFLERRDVITEGLLEFPEGHMATLKVLAELPKVAKVVLQFSNRYSDWNEEECASELLPALAVLVRSRLMAITNNATAW